MPDSSAASFICFLVMPICTSEAAALSITVESMISMDGHTSDGAKEKICEIYKSDIRLDKPTEKILLRIILHSELTDEARLASSPEENPLKKLTGSESILIMTDASTL